MVKTGCFPLDAEGQLTFQLMLEGSGQRCFNGPGVAGSQQSHPHKLHVQYIRETWQTGSFVLGELKVKD